MKFVLVFLSLFSIQAYGTDCHANCESHFSNWWQSPDLERCKAERELACKTNITTCDIWRANPSTVGGYYGAIEIIQASNRQNGWPKNANSCHSAVNLGEKASSAVGAAKFLYQVWDTGFKMSNILSKSTLVGLIISEGAKSFAHCACTHAKYEVPDDENPSKDRYYASFFGPKWSVSWGPNNFNSRKSIFHNTKVAAGEPTRNSQTGHYGSAMRTVAEAICEEGTFWATNTGDQSLKIASDEVKNRNWKNCLFRVKNFPSGNPFVSDLYFASLGRKDGAWALRTGKIEEKESVLQAAKSAMGNRFDTIYTGRYSSTRETITFTACDKPDTSTGPISISESSIFISGGHGGHSVEKALDIVKRQHNGESCTFRTRDIDFGPLN